MPFPKLSREIDCIVSSLYYQMNIQYYYVDYNHFLAGPEAFSSRKPSEMTLNTIRSQDGGAKCSYLSFVKPLKKDLTEW
jgi:hypothetical protein